MKQKGHGKQKNAANALSEVDEEHLWKAEQLGKHSAQALVNVNFKNLTDHFGRGRQEHYSMNLEDFQLITNPDNSVRYVSFKEAPTKTRQGGLRIIHRAAQPKMFAMGGERCPVNGARLCRLRSFCSGGLLIYEPVAIYLGIKKKHQKLMCGSVGSEWASTKLEAS